MKKKILVKGYFKANLGDDLFLKVLADRYPNEKFEILTTPELYKYYASFKNVHIVKQNFLFKVVDKMLLFFSSGGIYKLLKHRYSAVIEIGGSIFPQPKDDLSLTKERKFLEKNFKNYFVIGSNFGPYSSEKFIDNYKDFFKKISGTVFRDRKSKKLFSDLKNVTYAPDVVLNLKNNEKTSYELIEKQYVAVSVIDLGYSDISRNENIKNFKESYEANILTAIVNFARLGYDIKFVPFSEKQNDLTISNDLAKKLKVINIETNIEVLAKANIDEKVKTIRESSYLISTRYHSMILGWVFGIKQEVFIYADKTRNVIEDLFPQQYAYDILQDQDYTFNLDSFNTMNHVEDIRKNAEKQFYFLDHFLA